MCQLAPCQLVSETNDARLAKRAKRTSRDTCLLPIPQLEDEVRACQDIPVKTTINIDTPLLQIKRAAVLPPKTYVRLRFIPTDQTTFAHRIRADIRTPFLA